MADKADKTVVKRGRGRPRKIKTTDNLAHPEETNSIVKVSKFLGFCSACKATISSLDLEKDKKSIFVCPSCANRSNINTLHATLGLERAKTKKEYMDQTIVTHSSHDANKYHDHHKSIMDNIKSETQTNNEEDNE